jgi:YHS domain-containing protein
MIDPVCGMEVTKDSKYKHLYKGTVYYFCSNSCKMKFERDPEKYLREGPKGMD